MKLTVIGAGTIGAGVTYNAALRDVFDEILLVDLNEEKAQGEALDVAHAAATFADADVYQGTYDDAADSDVVAVTAGKPRKEGMTRLDLLEANAAIMAAIHDNDFGDDAVFVTTTNPMDVINYTHTLVADYPRERFIGFGGMLDSARAQYVLAQYLDEPASAVEATVIGEHGDSQVPLFSQATVGGAPTTIPADERDMLKEQMRQSAMDVISRKGYTQWGPTYLVGELLEAIATDAATVHPCSAVLDSEFGHENVSIGVPCRVGRDGIQEIVEPAMDEQEASAFHESVEELAAMCTEADDLVDKN
jgi:malate dehydrogenase